MQLTSTVRHARLSDATNIYDLINAAIMSQLSPDPPGGTGNDKPPQ